MSIISSSAPSAVWASTVGTERRIAATDFFLGFLENALHPEELLVEVVFPAATPATRSAVCEVSRRHGDFAMLGVATTLEMADDSIASAALAFFGAVSTPVRRTAVEEALTSSPATAETFEQAARLASEHLDPPADLHASANYRRHLAGVLTNTSLTEATSGAAT